MGRPRKTQATREAQQTLDEACVYASKLVRDIVRGTTAKKGATGITLVKMGRVSGAKLVAAKIAIEQSLGLPKAKVYFKTDALTMRDIAEMAATFGEDNAGNGDKDGDNSLDNVPIIAIPTKPLTARQVKERARDRGEN